jgi:hypothetical protein
MSQTPTSRHQTGIADTGASSHYIRPADPHTKTGASRPAILVGLPNGDILQSTQAACQLNLSQLPEQAREAHIIPGLTHSSLISIGKLCDSGCKATFDAKQVVITRNDKELISGPRDNQTGLWRIPLINHTPTNTVPTPMHMECNNAYQTHKIPELIQFLHAAAFSPVTSTWIAAIQRGFFQSWPGLTAAAVKKHLPASEATAKGHLDQIRKNIRSTKHDSPEPEPEQEPNNAPTHQMFATIESTGKIYTDQTGRFPVTSSTGHKYILVLYDYDTNAILTEAIKNRTATEIMRAYQKLFSYLQTRGFRPKTHWLDNEASNLLKQFNKTNNVDFQLVPPHMHRRNAAERAIRTWKNHFVSGLCSTDSRFPLHLWDRLLAQATITLNLLRPSRRNPKVSAYTMLEGTFDFNKTPMAPPGTKIIIHEKPQQRNSWDPHGAEGWYIGPAMEHYRCYRVFTNKTKAERITDTIEFFPEHTSLPFMNSNDIAIKAANELITTLQNPLPATPFAQVGNQQLEALQQLAELFKTQHHNTDKRLPRVREPSPAPLPRVVNRILPPQTHSPTMPASPKQHRYPTRHTIPYNDEEANHIVTIDNTDILSTKEPATQWANAIIDPDTGASMEYRHLLKSPKHCKAWTHSFANELGRLAQGVGGRQVGTNTIFYIQHNQIPADRRKDVTYGRICVDYRPQKEEPNRTRLTVGGNLIDFPGDVSTPTADTTTAKMVINSTISTTGARYMCGDIKDFYLGTPMARYEYMRMPITLIPQEIIDEYNLHPLVHNGHVYMEIRRGMYGLPQAGIIANQLLTERLQPEGYYQCRHTPGLWRHKWRPIMFSLVVDDFGVKYVGKQHVDHLIAAIEKHYTKFSKDWEGKLYCGIHIKWNYTTRTVDLSMPGYIAAALHKFQHPKLNRAQHAPHKWNEPIYGAKIQLADPIDQSEPLPPEGIKRVQQITGTLLYYARAVDPTMLVALGTIAAQQSHGTAATADAIVQLLDYCATHPDSTIRYRASDMILRIHSDASYLSEAKARSRSGGHFYLGDKDSNSPEVGNGAILTTSTIIRNVMSSAAEAECGALFNNTKDGVALRNTLHEMGHPQPPTPVQVDNSTSNGFANKQIRQRKSKSMDMRFYWVQDRVEQKQFHVYWRPGHTNLADYFTKHHSPSHHRRERSTYLHCPEQASLVLRGCVNPGSIPHGTHPTGTPSHHNLMTQLPRYISKLSKTNAIINATINRNYSLT